MLGVHLWITMFVHSPHCSIFRIVYTATYLHLHQSRLNVLGGPGPARLMGPYSL